MVKRRYRLAQVAFGVDVIASAIRPASWPAGAACEIADRPSEQRQRAFVFPASAARRPVDQRFGLAGFARGARSARPRRHRRQQHHHPCDVFTSVDDPHARFAAGLAGVSRGAQARRACRRRRRGALAVRAALALGRATRRGRSSRRGRNGGGAFAAGAADGASGGERLLGGGSFLGGRRAGAAGAGGGRRGRGGSVVKPQARPRGWRDEPEPPRTNSITPVTTAAPTTAAMITPFIDFRAGAAATSSTSWYTPVRIRAESRGHRRGHRRQSLRRRRPTRRWRRRRAAVPRNLRHPHLAIVRGGGVGVLRPADDVAGGGVGVAPGNRQLRQPGRHQRRGARRRRGRRHDGDRRPPRWHRGLATADRKRLLPDHARAPGRKRQHRASEVFDGSDSAPWRRTSSRADASSSSGGMSGRCARGGATSRRTIAWNTTNTLSPSYGRRPVTHS